MNEMTIQGFMDQWREGIKDTKPEDYMTTIVLHRGPKADRRRAASMRARKARVLRQQKAVRVFPRCYPVSISEPVPQSDNMVAIDVIFEYKVPATN